MANIVREICARWYCFLFHNLKHNFWKFIIIRLNIYKKTIFEFIFMLYVTYFEKNPCWAIDRYLFKYGFLDLYWLYSEWFKWLEEYLFFGVERFLYYLCVGFVLYTTRWMLVSQLDHIYFICRYLFPRFCTVRRSPIQVLTLFCIA